MTRRLLLSPLLALAACGQPAPHGPLVASVIGGSAGLPSPVRAPIGRASAVMLSAVAQGLVRFDAQGQIEAGLAERWDVSDDGLYYTFRIAEGSSIDAEAAARLLRRAVDRTSHNPLRPLLGSIAEIVAVTPQVIEIRLSAPRADLLQLLAAPELALARENSGGGPFRVAGHDGGRITLVAAAPPADGAPPAATAAVTVRAERAALAIARFARGRAALVIGGGFDDLPIVRAAGIDPAALRFDPVEGLFGLRVMRAEGYLADPVNRRRLSRAIDRVRIVQRMGVPGLTIVSPVAEPPEQAAPSPAAATPVVVRLALPEGPGATLLYRLIAADWARIGVTAERLGPADPRADLILIDEIAPTDAPDWAVALFGCAWADGRPCSEAADTALASAATVADPDAHAAQTEDARTSLLLSGLYMPITEPVSWSLVARDLTGWQGNPRAAHPLDQLRK